MDVCCITPLAHTDATVYYIIYESPFQTSFLFFFFFFVSFLLLFSTFSSSLLEFLFIGKEFFRSAYSYLTHQVYSSKPTNQRVFFLDFFCPPKKEKVSRFCPFRGFSFLAFAFRFASSSSLSHTQNVPGHERSRTRYHCFSLKRTCCVYSILLLLV